jgi:putative phosphoribosyl transferase
MMIYRDRKHAGEMLAKALADQAGPDVVVVGLPRGGVPVAYEVARALGAPLDVFVVRKLGVPFQPELAMGAIASGGILVRNENVLRLVPDSDASLELVRRREQAVLEDRERQYRGQRPALDVAGRKVIVVDDGLATGSTMKAAVQALKAGGASSVVVAVPVGPPDTCRELKRLADVVVCLQTPALFSAVGQWYEDFGQTRDEEVGRLLAATAA